MVTNIIQIGNSKGIILPSEILKQLRLSLKSAVSISLDGNNIVIKGTTTAGMGGSCQTCHENGDDELLIPDVFGGIGKVLEGFGQCRKLVWSVW